VLKVNSRPAEPHAATWNQKALPLACSPMLQQLGIRSRHARGKQQTGLSHYPTFLCVHTIGAILLK